MIEKEAFRRAMWELCCRHSISHAQTLGTMSSRLAGRLMLNLAYRFRSLPMPTTDDELWLRQLQMTTVSAMMNSISLADPAIGKGDPDLIYAECEQLSEREVPKTADGCYSLFLELVSFGTQTCRRPGMQ